MKHLHRGPVAVLFTLALNVSTLAQAAPVSGQGTWETTLQGRDLDGNLSTAEAYYDTALGITWLANANYAGIQMDWVTASTWASGLNVYGITGWRLPFTIDADGPDADSLGDDGCDQIPSGFQGLDCSYNFTVHSEMSYMFYVTLGNKAFWSTSGTPGQPGWGLTNTGPFSNIVPDAYWSATEYAPNVNDAWYFIPVDGYQNHTYKTNPFLYAWAVHPDDIGVSLVPVPAAVWLFGSGLLSLLGAAGFRRRC